MKTFEEYRSELDVPNLLMSGNCCRHAFNAGQESRQAEIDKLQGRIDKLIPKREGFVLVPVEPTLKMVRASEHIKSSKTIRQDIYRAMIEAANEN